MGEMRYCERCNEYHYHRDDKSKRLAQSRINFHIAECHTIPLSRLTKAIALLKGPRAYYQAHIAYVVGLPVSLIGTICTHPIVNRASWISVQPLSITDEDYSMAAARNEWIYAGWATGSTVQEIAEEGGLVPRFIRGVITDRWLTEHFPDDRGEAYGTPQHTAFSDQLAYEMGQANRWWRKKVLETVSRERKEAVALKM